MGDYQKELALSKLEKASEMLETLTSRDGALLVPEHKNELKQIMELIIKAKEHISNV